MLVLDLVKQTERREREVIVGREYRRAVEHVNSTMPLVSTSTLPPPLLFSSLNLPFGNIGSNTMKFCIFFHVSERTARIITMRTWLMARNFASPVVLLIWDAPVVASSGD